MDFFYAHVAKLVNVAVSEAVGVITLGVRVSPWAQCERGDEKFILRTELDEVSKEVSPWAQCERGDEKFILREVDEVSLQKK
jgi:hypothetical protein